ncbi:Mitogen-activated protein kinase hog1 [Ceratocystis lukuohia]|uniref:mitogen-activated protein kinase n=1 Tax=Ceratocystis lukuohia TaxID=2019550 RepID=A0ABR4MST0_9PEZI
MAEFVRTEIFGTMFDITSRYTQVQPVGMGAFGLVCSARDQLLNQSVAIKKIVKPFKTDVLAKRTYRELKLLMNLRHENRALKFVHSAGIIHRDLKPSNILINENCDLKICDFGLARIQDPLMTGYVATRYYRAPEIMLSWQKYDVAVDIWSVGCILAEMITGSPLFPGKDHVNQFSIITELIGNPPEYIIGGITSENSLPAHEPVSFKTKFPTATPEAIDLLERFLVFDPRRRLTAADALRHPYLELYHDPEDEPEAPHPFDFEDGINASADIWKVKMYDDILSFHNRTQAEENGENYEEQQQGQDPMDQYINPNAFMAETHPFQR